VRPTSTWRTLAGVTRRCQGRHVAGAERHELVAVRPTPTNVTGDAEDGVEERT
jgi:hypothetical protein